jgi:hypothetical protein
MQGFEWLQGADSQPRSNIIDLVERRHEAESAPRVAGALTPALSGL